MGTGRMVAAHASRSHSLTPHSLHASAQHAIFTVGRHPFFEQRRTGPVAIPWNPQEAKPLGALRPVPDVSASVCVCVSWFVWSSAYPAKKECLNPAPQAWCLGASVALVSLLP